MTKEEIQQLDAGELERQIRIKAVEMHNAGVITDDTYIGVLRLATNGSRYDQEQWLIWAIAAGSTQ